LKFELKKLCLSLKKVLFDTFVKENYRERCVSRTYTNYSKAFIFK
jgi:hypothetical protein